MASSDSALDPIVLNGWPSCTNCISWSSDGELAVATGEYVHILTPKQAPIPNTQPGHTTIGLRHWHSARIQTNIFRQREWPSQEPAPSYNFSIGEEQSLSTVAGVAWSPPGIGTHKRSMLGLMTSNHVLSLWESNGTIGEWTRVAVANHSLGDYFGWVGAAGEDVHRHRRRIRAFAWSPSYRILQDGGGRTFTSKWGAFYLAVANDDEAVIILRVSKSKRKGQVEWNVAVTGHVNLPAVPMNCDMLRVASLFQKAMTSKCPISSLLWTDLNNNSSISFIHVTQRGRRSCIKVQASLHPTENGSVDLLEHDIELNLACLEDSRPQNGHGLGDPPNERVPANLELKKKMEEARIEFDSNHSLDGNSIVRDWGFAASDTQDAACITIHPSDMVEYTTPSLEKCTILFAPRPELMDSAQPPEMTAVSPMNVLHRICSWTLSAANRFPLTLMIDRQLLGISAAYAAHLDNQGMRQKAQFAFYRLHETSESQLDRDDMEVEEALPIDSPPASDIETCLICQALILFDEHNLSRARCETGHQYSTSYSRSILC